MEKVLSDLELGEAGSAAVPSVDTCGDCRTMVRHDLAALAGPWSDLERRAGGTIFQSYAWCSTWAEACRRAGRPEDAHIITVWKDARLVLLWPLARRRLGPFRILQSFGEPATQYCDALIEPGPDREIWLELAWSRIRTLRGLDAVLLKGVRSDAAIAPLAGSWNVSSAMRLDSAPLVDFRPGGAPWRRSSRTRNALQRHLRNLARHGTVGFAMIEGEAERADAMREALRLKHDWLDRTAQFSAGYAHPANEAFLERLAGCRDFVVARLSVDGRTAAIEAGLLRDGYYWSLVQSYDAGYAQHGPGRLLFWQIIERASTLGIEVLDFLAPAYPHKREWANAEIAVRDYVVPLRPWSWVIVSYMRHARPHLKAWLRRMPRSLRFDLPGPGGR